MANVVSVAERFQQATAKSDINGEVFTREFRVLFDAADTLNPHTCLTATDGTNAIPAQGSALSSGSSSLCVNNKTSRCLDTKSRLLWQVLVEYGSGFHLEVKKNAKPQQQTQVEPWSKPALFAYDFEKGTKVLEQDYSSAPKLVVNSAGEPFDPSVMVPSYNGKIVCSRATLTYSSSAAASLIGRVNNASVTVDGISYDVNHLLLLRWAGNEQTYTDNTTGEETTYYQESVELLVALNATGGHNLNLLDQGYSMISENGGIRRILGDDGKVLASPALLSEGQPLAIGSPGVFLTFQPYPSVDFSPLGLS